jgi:nitrite reductase (NADH) large subunit
MAEVNTYLLVGCGVAAVTAAREIRKLDRNGKIILVGDEPYYYRGSLSEWISGRTTEEMLPGRTAGFYQQLHLERVEGRVERIDPAEQIAALADGRIFHYDRLLIATGAKAREFPIPGLDSSASLRFRSLEDAGLIKEKAGCCGRVLILGGGVLGLELAGALSSMGGKQIAVVQLLPFMGIPLLDEHAALWLHERMRAAGVELFLEDTVVKVDNSTAEFRSGRKWDFDLFVQSVGIAPAFPEVPGLETGVGIRIANNGATNLENIFAAGDCTETKPDGHEAWQQTRTWLESSRQGKIAGCGMVQPEMHAPESSVFYNSSILFDLFYSYIGDPHGEGGDIFRWESGGGMRKIRVVDGRLEGALLLGERRQNLSVLHAVGKEVLQGARIADPNFHWNDLTGQDWDYRFY